MTLMNFFPGRFHDPVQITASQVLSQAMDMKRQNAELVIRNYNSMKRFSAAAVIARALQAAALSKAEKSW